MSHLKAAYNRALAAGPDNLNLKPDDYLYSALRALNVNNLQKESPIVLTYLIAYAKARDIGGWFGLDFVADVEAERKRQDAQWGGPLHDDMHSARDWLRFLRKYANDKERDIRKRHVIVAALLVAYLEWLDRQSTSYPKQVDDMVLSAVPPNEYIHEVHSSYDGENRSDPYENWKSMNAQQRGEIAFRIIQERYSAKQKDGSQTLAEKVADRLRSGELSVAPLHGFDGARLGWAIADSTVTEQAQAERVPTFFGTDSVGLPRNNGGPARTTHWSQAANLNAASVLPREPANWQRESRQAQNSTPIQTTSAHITPMVFAGGEPFGNAGQERDRLYRGGVGGSSSTGRTLADLCDTLTNNKGDGRTNLPMTVEDLASAIRALSQEEQASKTIAELAHQFGVTEELMVDAAKIAFNEPDELEKVANAIRIIPNAEAMSAFGIAQTLGIPVDVAQAAREQVFPTQK